jgi:hypothetical protein
MKFDVVTQWVISMENIGKVSPDKSLANMSVGKSEGKPGNGSPKPDGTRLQAVYRAPKSCSLWSTDNFRETERKADALYIGGRQQFRVRYGDVSWTPPGS